MSGHCTSVWSASRKSEHGGRFDEIFFLELPTLAERQEIFTVHLRKRKRLPQDFDAARLARESEGYVGADIEQAIFDTMHVGFNAGREFTTKDISAALKRPVPLPVLQHGTIEALVWKGLMEHELAGKILKAIEPRYAPGFIPHTLTIMERGDRRCLTGAPRSCETPGPF